MKYSFATEENEPEIKQLLIDCNLHHDDITTAQLRNFLLGWDGPRLVAVVGLEIKNHSALLRSLAVDADYRNRRIATRLVGKIDEIYCHFIYCFYLLNFELSFTRFQK